MLSAFMKRFWDTQENKKDNSNSTNPILFQKQLEVKNVESTTILNNNSLDTFNISIVDKIKNEQITNNNSEDEQVPILQDPYCIFQKSLENFSPDDIGDLTELTLSYQFRINDTLKFVEIVFEEAIRNPKQAASFVALIKKQQKFIQNYFLTLCTNLIIRLRNDFLLKNNDDLKMQAKGIGTLIGEMFNQNLLTWQNIEAHLQRLMANGYTSKGSMDMIESMFISCGAKLKKVMPAGCFNSLHSTFLKKCSKISACNTLSIVNIEQNKFQQNQTFKKKDSTSRYVLKNVEQSQSIVQKKNQFTYVDFERIVLQQKPSYENIIRHLNSVDINADLGKYVNLIVSETLKKPSMTKTNANILNEMRFTVKKNNEMELKLNELLQNEIAKYLEISHRNLKTERPKLQQQAQILGNFIGELYKIDLIECLTIDSFFQKLLDKNQLKEGCLDLVCNIMQSCASELKTTLGTIKFNYYITQLKHNTNPFNMSSSIYEKVKSIKLHQDTNTKSVKDQKVSSSKVADNLNSNNSMDQSSTSHSKTSATTSQLSNNDELLEKLTELQQFYDGDDTPINKDLLNAYSKHNQMPAKNVKLSLNYANAIDNLSLENFEYIKGHLKGFQINTSEKVNIFVDSIFQRKLKGPEIDVKSAELCKELYSMSTISIKCMVREKVVNLFESHSLMVKNDLRLLRSNKNDTMTYDRINGFTKFVVEFFKIDLLPVNYVHTHMQRLLDLNYICESSVYLASFLLLSCGTELYNTNYQLGVLERFVINLESFCQKTRNRKEVMMNFKKIIELQQNDWQIIKNTTTVKNAMNDNQPSTSISREIPNAHMETPKSLDAKSTKDEPSNEVMKSIIGMILSDPLSTSKFVHEVAKTNDENCIDLLMIECNEELVKYFKIVSLYTGKDELLELIYKIQNEEDLQKRKELKIILDCRLDAPKNAVLIVKLIGELYNFDLLDSSRMECMEYLLDSENINESTIVCLCKFLSTIRSKLISDEQGLEVYQKYSKKLIGILKNQAFNMPPHVEKLIEELIEFKETLMLK